MNNDANIPNKILANQIQQIKRLCTVTKLDLVLECKDSSTYENWSMKCVTSTKWREETTQSCQLLQKKKTDKIKHPFMIKISNKLGIEGNYLHIIKVIHEKHIANIILNGERWKTFPLRPEQSKDACFHHFHTTWNQQF